MAKGASICALLCYTFYRSMVVFAVCLPLSLLYPHYEKRKKKKERLNKLLMEFKEGMVILAGALSAGYSIENALRTSQKELVLLYGEEVFFTRELGYMVQQIQTNRPIEQVLQDFSHRSGLEDIKNFTEVFCVAKRSGGDLSGIMKHTADMIREKLQVKEEIATLTASKKFEQKIMNLIPFFIVFYVEGSSPKFFDQMYTTGFGRLLMTGCLVVYVIAYILAQKMLAIEV